MAEKKKELIHLQQKPRNRARLRTLPPELEDLTQPLIIQTKPRSRPAAASPLPSKPAGKPKSAAGAGSRERPRKPRASPPLPGAGRQERLTRAPGETIAIRGGDVHEAAERAKARLNRTPDRRRSLGSRYKLGRRLGVGATGEVYKARDLLLDMPVATKILSRVLAKDPEAVKALRHEARITLQLSHRYIIRLHNLEKMGRTYFLVMEYVEGETLRHIVNQCGPFDHGAVADIVVVACEALHYAHRHGILHNDLKPDNLMLAKNGVLKVIDFGIACLINRQWRDEYIMGTPAYMSPEQARGEELDCRTDVYAMGIIAHELLTATLPFAGGQPPGEIREVQDLDFSVLPEPVCRVLEKATAGDREERWLSADSFSKAFADAMASAYNLQPSSPSAASETQ